MTCWAAATRKRGAFDSLLDDYPLLGPEARSVIEPIIGAKIVDERKRSIRNAGLQKKISSYSNRLRKLKASA